MSKNQSRGRMGEDKDYLKEIPEKRTGTKNMKHKGKEGAVLGNINDKPNKKEMK